MTEEAKSEEAAETGAGESTETAEPETAAEPSEKASERASADTPEKEAGSPPPPDYKFLGITGAIMLAADLVTKEWAAKRLEGPGVPPIEVIERFDFAGYTFGLNFDLAKNRGGAWGVLGEQPDYVRLPFFFIISALAVVFIVGLYRKLEPHQWALKWALPLVLAGALGNLVDRIRHQHVIDFIDAFMIKNNVPSHWPTFNVADIWIVAGVILMAIDWFSPNRTPKRSRERRPVRVRG